MAKIIEGCKVTSMRNHLYIGQVLHLHNNGSATVRAYSRSANGETWVPTLEEVVPIEWLSPLTHDLCGDCERPAGACECYRCRWNETPEFGVPLHDFFTHC